MEMNRTGASTGPTPDVQELVRDFPLPLALLDANGRIEISNDQFNRYCEVGSLTHDFLRSVMEHAADKEYVLRLVDRNGHECEARAHSSRLHNGVLLVINEFPGVARGADVEHLYQRILELEKLSATDQLTGAWNRAHLDRMVESELSRSLRFRQPLSLVLIDIDHFKRVNDRFGHQVGDSVLVEMVNFVKESIRSADTLFRWGGEEFVVLTAATGYRHAALMADALRAKVERHSFATVGQVTISLGVAEHVGSESVQEWFSRVDAALYSAKESGRNCIRVDRRGSSDRWAAASGASALHLVWTEAYECGEPTIDGQHRELFNLANALMAASFNKEASPDVFDAALDRLITHIVHHFTHEEALLEQHHYVHLGAHKRAHAALLKRAYELKADATAGKGTLGGLIEFLANDVVAHHLFSADRSFFPLLVQGNRKTI